MNCTIYLIVEDLRDKEIVEAFLKARKLSFKIVTLQPISNAKGISRLPEVLDRVIQSVQKPGDCIAVLHDADELTQSNRDLYNKIRDTCKRFGIAEVIARDEIEAWLLADEGIAKWLGIRHENYDEAKKPSDILAKKLRDAGKKPFSGSYREKVLEKVNGNSKSPSMQAALQQLEVSPCYQNVAESQSDL